MSNPNSDPLPQAKALYQLLIGPTAGDLRQAGAKMLMLSLDDTLRYLPFAALNDGNGYLIEKMSISLVNEAVRDGLDQAYPIVHIASHFRFEPGSMDDPVLLMGDGTLMTMAQIKTKLNFNNVDLLTLSASETAVGDDGEAHHGIEVEGLGAIALKPGHMRCSHLCGLSRTAARRC